MFRSIKQFGKMALLFSILISLVILTGCSTTQTPPDQSGKAPEQSQSLQTTYPLTFKDDFDVEVTLPKKPERIVSFVPASTETLFALGLEGSVIAVTQYDNYPEGVQNKVEYVFEDSLKPNVEQVLKLNPDLIVLGMHDEKTVSSLRNLQIPVVQMNPQSLNETYLAIEKFGLLTGTQAEAKKIVEEMKQKEKNISDKVATIKESERTKVWLEVDPNLFTAGEGTFLDELLSKAGGINIAKDVKGWAQYSAEQVIAQNPQVILDTYSYYVPNVKESILSRPAWQSIDAVKSKRVYDLNSDMVTRPGPRIVEGLDSIAQALYPELFK